MILWVGYLGAFPTALAFTTWAYALARSTAGKMGATTLRGARRGLPHPRAPAYRPSGRQIS